MGFVLNIENWQKPDTVTIEEDNLPEPVILEPDTIVKEYVYTERINGILTPVKKQVKVIVNAYNVSKTVIKRAAPAELRGDYIIIFYDKNNPIEGKLHTLEQLKKEYMTAKPLDKYSIGIKYKDIAETYNLLVGFECMETEITKLNFPLTNNNGKIVLNF